jgi:hypothetical protein
MPLLEQRYRLAYAEQPAQGARLVPERLMYGTDWNLVMTAGDIGSYMESFVTVIDSLPSAGSVVDGHSVRDRFFGWNAAEYLGLKKGQPARNRLEAFYKKNEIDVAKSPPGWMPKVDQSS